jgi:hypothetical protein
MLDNLVTHLSYMVINFILKSEIKSINYIIKILFDNEFYKVIFME